jgi:hypothetical protein
MHGKFCVKAAEAAEFNGSNVTFFGPPIKADSFLSEAEAVAVHT